MISPEAESLVRKLLVEGLSQRAIARRTGLSRGTVGSIANGKRRPALRTGDGSFEYTAGDPETVARCGECGARVVMPCLACFCRAVRRFFVQKRENGGSSGKAVP